MKVLGFDWDEGNRYKCEKHGVSIAQIEAALRRNPVIAPDFNHSSDEKRYIAISRTTENRAVYIAFTFRDKAGKRLVRPVSARYMHRKEIAGYEKKVGSHTGSHNDDG